MTVKPTLQVTLYAARDASDDTWAVTIAVDDNQGLRATWGHGPQRSHTKGAALGSAFDWAYRYYEDAILANGVRVVVTEAE